LLKSSLDFFWIELSLTMSQSCLEFNWWAIGEVLLGIGSKYWIFLLRKMHQKCQKVASLVEGFSITFRLWKPLQFLFLDTLCGFSDMLLTFSRSPSRTCFHSFCHLLLGHSLDIFLSSICMSHVCTQIYIIYILNIT